MRRLLIVAALLCVAIPVYGQTTVVNPTTLEFTPSVDHNATAPLDGTPLVTRYDAKYYLATQCNPSCPTTVPAPAFVLSLGKPTPSNNTITVTNVFNGLVLNQAYKAVVVAVGPGGTSANSNATDPFGNRGPLAAPAPVSGVVVR